MIYVDSSIALARLLFEPRAPRAPFWQKHLVSSRLLEYEVWNRVHAYGLISSHGQATSALLAGVDGRRGDVLLQLNSPLFFQDRQRTPAVALDHRLPSMAPFRQWVDEGGLMSYGASLTDMGRLAADFIDRIAKGAKPVDLPVQQPTRFELVVNLKAAKELELTIPPAIMIRANDTIE